MSDEVLMKMAKAMDGARKRRGLGGPDLMAVGLRAALEAAASDCDACEGTGELFRGTEEQEECYICDGSAKMVWLQPLLRAANLSEGEGADER